MAGQLRGGKLKRERLSYDAFAHKEMRLCGKQENFYKMGTAALFK